MNSESTRKSAEALKIIAFVDVVYFNNLHHRGRTDATPFWDE